MQKDHFWATTAFSAKFISLKLDLILVAIYEPSPAKPKYAKML